MLHHLNRDLIKQFLRFGLVGLSGTAMQYVSLWIGHGYLGVLTAPSASAIGYLLGTLVNYWLNYVFTFGSSKTHGEAAVKYFSIVGIGWCINYSMMGLLVNHYHVYYWFAQLMITGIVFIWNFSGSKWWAFRHKPT